MVKREIDALLEKAKRMATVVTANSLDIHGLSDSDVPEYCFITIKHADDFIDSVKGFGVLDKINNMYTVEINARDMVDNKQYDSDTRWRMSLDVQKTACEVYADVIRKAGYEVDIGYKLTENAFPNNLLIRLNESMENSSELIWKEAADNALNKLESLKQSRDIYSELYDRQKEYSVDIYDPEDKITSFLRKHKIGFERYYSRDSIVVSFTEITGSNYEDFKSSVQIAVCNAFADVLKPFGIETDIAIFIR